MPGVVLEEIDDHAQAREVFAPIGRGCAQLFPLLVRLQVLRAQGGAGVGAQPEQPRVSREDRRRPLSRRIGQNQLYFRRSLRHAGELGWIVVDEEDGRRMQVELGGDGEEVVGLGSPVDAHGGEIVQGEDKLLALGEEPLHVGPFVS